MLTVAALLLLCACMHCRGDNVTWDADDEVRASGIKYRVPSWIKFYKDDLEQHRFVFVVGFPRSGACSGVWMRAF